MKHIIIASEILVNCRRVVFFKCTIEYVGMDGKCYRCIAIRIKENMSENRTYLEKKALYASDVFHTHVLQIKFSSLYKEIGDSKRNMKCIFQELFSGNCFQSKRASLMSLLAQLIVT